MPQLNELHRGLRRVGRYRSTARFASALAVFGTIVLWLLLAAFLLDVRMHMGRLERFLILAVIVGVAVWAFRRFLLPAFQTHEEEVQLALMVERQQGVKSDLVASLQFADPNRAQFGSPQLREAVVERGDKLSGRLNYLEGFSREEMFRRVIFLVATIAIVLIPIIAYGGHVRAFMNRMLLGNTHYPTKTIIEAIVSPGDSGVYGQPIVFKVRLDGELPAEGIARLQAINSDVETVVALKPDESDSQVFVGELARALDDISYTLHLGDAYTDPATFRLVPLPIVQVDLQIETPAYAAEKFAATQVGPQRIALEGSRVVPIVTSKEKALRTATLAIGDEQFELTKDGDKFTLNAANTPLASVTSTLRYEVQVEDEDGLSLERPVAGTLQVRADQPPRIAAATMTQYVLPTASPSIRIRAIDDYALDRIEVTRIVEREQPGAETMVTTTLIADIKDHRDKFDGDIPLDISDLQLKKGDRVTVTFRAVDYRGEKEGKMTTGDELVFQVTDRAGILASLRQLDAQMDKKLDEIIKAQLGYGG